MMATKSKVLCGLILFVNVLGLRFVCANCQRYPPHQKELQMQKFQKHIPLQQRLQAVAVPTQMDVLLTKNRLQSQQPLGVEVSVADRDISGSAGGQNEYFTDWSHVDNSNADQEEIPQQWHCLSKNCKRKRNAQKQISTSTSQARNRVEDDQSRGRLIGIPQISLASKTTSTVTAEPTISDLSAVENSKQSTHALPLSIARDPYFQKSDFTSTTISSEESKMSVEYQMDSSTPSSITSTEHLSSQTDPEPNFVEDSLENKVSLQVLDLTNYSLPNETNSTITVHDQEEINTKDQDVAMTDRVYQSLKNSINKNFPNVVLMDTDPVNINLEDDHTDLLKPIEDRRSDNHLINNLGKWNMTLEELIEHRKRALNQLHLSNFVRNRSGIFPDKKAVDGMDIVTAFENFPHFNLPSFRNAKSDEMRTDSQESADFPFIVDAEPTDEVLKDGSGSISIEPRRNSILYRSDSGIQPRPSLKNLDVVSIVMMENAKRFLQRSDPGLPQQTNLQHQSTEIENDATSLIEHARPHDLVDLELSGHGFKRSAMNLIHASHVPSGIRSAIVACAAIVLASLLTFMVIFIACRWKQRKRICKLNYIEACNVSESELSVISSRKVDELVTSTSSLWSESVPTKTCRSNTRQRQHNQISIVIPDGDMHTSTLSSNLNTVDNNFSAAQGDLFMAQNRGGF